MQTGSTRKNKNKNLFASVLALGLAASASVACGNSSSENSGSSAPSNGSQNGTSSGGSYNNGSAQPSTGTTGAAAQRAIEEADIVQLEGGRLFAISKSGTLAIIDVSKPGRLAMLGQAYLPGKPFEMYLRGDLLVVMTNGAYSVSGSVNESSPSSSTQNGTSSSTTSASPAYPSDTSSGAGVIVLNVKDPGLMQRVATFPVAGEIADSRIVGDILYLATYENSSCYRCGSQPRTTVTTFDISSPSAMRQVDQLGFQSTADSYYGAYGFKRSVVMTKERMYVGGHGDLTDYSGGTSEEGVIDVIDVTDPTGKLAKGAHLTTIGAIMSRWQMDEKDGVLRVISQRGEGRVTNGIGMPEVTMFNIWNTRSFQQMGKTNIQLPRQESLKSVRFDGERAYAITFAQTDPLFVIDVKNPSAPKQRGQLTIPGYVFHLEPHGDRVLGLGVDRTDPAGNLNVSLFDVADMDNPRMLKRVSFGSTSGATNNAQVANYELPEDQDRIQKAFRVLDGGLVVVPFSGLPSYSSDGRLACSNTGGVQLIEWSQSGQQQQQQLGPQDTLVKRAMLPVAGNPRRALLNQQDGQPTRELLAVSDSNVTSFDLAQRDVALKTADLVIGTCEVTANNSVGVPTNVNDGRFNNGGNGGDFVSDDYYGPGFICSSAGTGMHAPGAYWTGLLLGLAAIGSAVRRSRRARVG